MVTLLSAVCATTVVHTATMQYKGSSIFSQLYLIPISLFLGAKLGWDFGVDNPRILGFFAATANFSHYI